MVNLEKYENGIYILKINRPEVLNALSDKVIQSLSEKISELKDLADLRVVIVTGQGEKAFVAGADIAAMKSMDATQAQAFGVMGQQVLSELESLNVPIIAAVNGFALGGGFELALACDYIFASDNAKFGLPEVTLGLIPGFGGTQRLSRNLGLSFAKYLITTGDMISAQDLKSRGLVVDVCPQAELLPKVIKVAQKITQKTGKSAVAASKNAIQKGFDLSLEEGLEFEVKSFSNLFSGAEAKEGMTAFVEKRPAKF